MILLSDLNNKEEVAINNQKSIQKVVKITEEVVESKIKENKTEKSETKKSKREKDIIKKGSNMKKKDLLLKKMKFNHTKSQLSAKKEVEYCQKLKRQVTKKFDFDSNLFLYFSLIFLL
jgi:hypothetical protein